MKLVNKHKRSLLCEGKNVGIGFAFAVQKDENTFETVAPISPCKDYLNDFVYSEITGNPVGIYGCNASKNDIFKDGVFLAMKVCPHSLGTSYTTYEKDKQDLNKNILGILKFLNKFERFLKFKERSEYIKIDEYEDVDKYTEEVYIFKLASNWIKATYLISLCTLLIRTGQTYNGKQNVFEYITSISGDYTINSVMPKVHRFKNEGIPEQDFDMLKSNSQIHNYGISAFQFKA